MSAVPIGGEDGAVAGERPWLKHYEPEVPTHLEYPEVALHDLLAASARHFPNRDATIFFGARLTYRSLHEQALRFANALRRLGVQKGDRVALMLPNCPQMVIAYYGALAAGAVVVATNPMYLERELQHQLSDAGAETIVLLTKFYPTLANVIDATPVRNVIVTNIKDYFPTPLRLLFTLAKEKKEGHRVAIEGRPGVRRFLDLLHESPPTPPVVPVAAGDLALLQYTGGTTGVAKGAMLTHYNLVANTVQTRYWMSDLKDGAETFLGVMPFFHVYGMTVAMNLAVMIAGTLILQPRFEVHEVLKAIHRLRPTIFPGVPTMYVAINNCPEVKRYDLRSIRACISGAAPLPVEVQARFEQLTGARLVEGYGLTEAAPVTHCNPIYGRRKAGSIGLPFPDVDAAIADLETGRVGLLPGEAGELVLRGPQVMAGYWGNPAETAQTLRNGWLYTGDIAKRDEDGYFYITDRKKDIIIAGGFNIYPREVEEVLYEHPKVKEAVVVGVPDAYRGETVKAFVVLKAGESATAEEIIGFCRERLAHFKTPKVVEFREALPKSLVGKILRRALREEERSELGV